MDEFDKLVSRAKLEQEPSVHFVNTVMSRIDAKNIQQQPIRMHWRTLFAGTAVLAVCAVIVVLISGHSYRQQLFAPQPSQSSTPAASNSSAILSPADSTDLASYTNGADAAINQEASDHTSTDAALNESQQQINVPTN